VSLLESEIPAHTHSMRAYNDVGEDRIPGPTEAIARSTGGQAFANPGPLVAMASQSLARVAAASRTTTCSRTSP
jgi:microcystin-dependent protein